MIVSISSARYINAKNSLIDMMVTDDKGLSFPFTFDLNDKFGAAPEVKKLLEAGGVTIAPFVEPAPEPAPVPASITRRQLLLGMYKNGIATMQEVIDSAQTGAPPAFIKTYFDSLIDEQSKVNAYVTWAAMSTVERNHPLIAIFAQQLKLSSEQVDDYFREAYTL